MTGGESYCIGRKAIQMERAMRMWIKIGAVGAVLVVAGFLYAGVHAAPRRESAASGSGGVRTPVLVELFTSEGCSSCPPADVLLEKFDRTQPIGAANVVVLGEHMDYWDDLGWRDPFSSRAISERQEAYAAGELQGTVYTPQMVVDGRYGAVGSDERRAHEIIEKAAREQKIAVLLSSARLDDGSVVALHVNADPLPAAAGSAEADVLIAVADDTDESQVQAGENSGRKLTHVAVLRSLTKAGVVSKSAGWSGDIKIPVERPGKKPLRVLGIVQTRAGRVWGVASVRIPARG
jgi:hypothetical protein